MRIGAVLKTATAAVMQIITGTVSTGRKVLQVLSSLTEEIMKVDVMVPLGAVAVAPAVVKALIPHSTQIDGIFTDPIRFLRGVPLAPALVTADGSMPPEMAHK